MRRRTSSMRRSVELARRTPLEAKGGDRFPDRRDDDYREFVRLQPCAVAFSAHYRAAGDGRRPCDGAVEATHVQSRGAGGGDRGNLLPLCHGHHMEQHTAGVRTFAERYAIDPAALARRLWEEYEMRHRWQNLWTLAPPEPQP